MHYLTPYNPNVIFNGWQLWYNLNVTYICSAPLQPAQIMYCTVKAPYVGASTFFGGDLKDIEQTSTPRVTPRTPPNTSVALYVSDIFPACFPHPLRFQMNSRMLIRYDVPMATQWQWRILCREVRSKILPPMYEYADVREDSTVIINSLYSVGTHAWIGLQRAGKIRDRQRTERCMHTYMQTNVHVSVAFSRLVFDKDRRSKFFLYFFLKARHTLHIDKKIRRSEQSP